MEYIITVLAVKIFKTCDFISFFIMFRITIGGKYYTYCGIILKLQIDLIQGSVDTCFEHIYDVILHSWQHNLCFRISKSCIIFQNLWSILCQHKSEENDPLECSSFGCHRIHSFLVNMLLAESVHFFRVERTWGKCSHSSCIQSLITIFGTLMILG